MVSRETQKASPALEGEWAIGGKQVVTPEGVRPAAVLVRGEKIVAVLSPDQLPAGCPFEDVGERVLLPGVIDTHVHINEPGRTEWEGFETATRAAAAGGITTLVDMPLNSSPVTTTSLALVQKQEAARGKLWVDCGFYGGVVPGNAGQIEALAKAGVLGFKAFLCHSGIDEFPNATEADLRAAMPRIAAAGRPLLVHAELVESDQGWHALRYSEGRARIATPFGVPQGVPPDAAPARSVSEGLPSLALRACVIATQSASDPRSYAGYLASRPRRWEHDAIELVLRLAAEFGCAVHIVHLSSADALPILEKARAAGLRVSVETCPHYLYFAAEEIPDGDPRFKCAPPLRERENRERLRAALREGLIDTIGSDHSPSPPEMKHLDTGDLYKAWGGIASLQLLLPVVWTMARQWQGVTLSDVSKWLSTRPARLVGLTGKKGALAAGCDADLIVFDAEAEFAVIGADLHHRHKLTPYEGQTLWGRVERTYLRGRQIYDAGRFANEAAGRVVTYNHQSAAQRQGEPPA